MALIAWAILFEVTFASPILTPYRAAAARVEQAKCGSTPCGATIRMRKSPDNQDENTPRRRRGPKWPRLAVTAAGLGIGLLLSRGPTSCPADTSPIVR